MAVITLDESFSVTVFKRARASCTENNCKDVVKE